MTMNRKLHISHPFFKDYNMANLRGHVPLSLESLAEIDQGSVGLG